MTSPETNKLLDEVERLNREAIAGPWWEELDEAAKVRDAADGQIAMLSNLAGRNGMLGRRDPRQVGNTARLIAHYRTSCPALAAEVRRLQRELETKEAQLKEADAALLAAVALDRVAWPIAYEHIKAINDARSRQRTTGMEE